MNVFDFIIVTVSTIDSIWYIAIIVSNSDSSVPDIFVAFKVFRVLRILKFARKWKALYNLLIVTKETFKSAAA